jgi:hypothetical protein
VGDRTETISDLDQRARELQEEGRWDAEAEEVNHRILELDRGHVPAAIRLGRCFEATGRQQEALDLYRWTGENADSSVARSRAKRLEQDMARAVKETGATAATAARAPGGRAPTLPPRVMNDDEIDKLMARALPDVPGREDALAFIAETIELALGIDPDRLLAIPLEQGKSFRLMGGRVSLLRTYKGAFYVEFDTRAAEKGLVEELEAAGLLDRHAPLRDIPTGVAAHIPFDAVAKWAPRLRPAHDAYVREAMATPLSAHHGRHQPALLARLRPASASE